MYAANWQTINIWNAYNEDEFACIVIYFLKFNPNNLSFLNANLSHVYTENLRRKKKIKIIYFISDGEV